MQQRTIDEINIILETLWAIKEDDKFYFMAYGKEMIENYITNKIKQNENNKNKIFKSGYKRN